MKLNNINQIRNLFFCALIFLNIAACGYKGDLYLASTTKEAITKADEKPTDLKEGAHSQTKKQEDLKNQLKVEE